MTRSMVRIDGDRKLIKQLQQLDKRPFENVARRAVRAATKLALPIARETVPVDTANLQRSLSVQIRSTSRQEVEGLIWPRKNFVARSGGRKIRISLGKGGGNRLQRKDHPILYAGIIAQKTGFLSDAAQSVRPQIMTTLSDSLWQGIRRITA